MHNIIKYNKDYYSQWNAFVASAKNATFLFHRDFIEYHSDQFKDYSLLIFENKKLVALLPANSVDSELHSHQGLTYGGLIYNEKIKQVNVILILHSILKFLSETGIIKIHIKLIPTIYHKLPSQEIDYALFLAEAKLSRRDSMSVIDFSNKIKIAGNRIEGVNKGLKNNFIVVEEEDFSRFWNEVLTVNLLKKYNVKPVHTLQEIMFLKKLFPKNIRLFVVYYEKNIVAGTVIFETENVAHAQYISASDNKNELGSLDFLYHHLITEVFAGKKYFDFGISNEQQGKKLNTGLIFWKESFGARTIVHDFYEVDTANYYKLENVAI